MKKLIITFLLCGWALNLYALPPFTSYGGSGTASDITFDNTEASLTGDPDDVQTAIEALKTEIGNISAGTLADIDDLPGDTVDDNKIDSSLINNATSTGLGVASFSNTTFTVSTAGAVSIKANVFQPYSATLADFSEGSPTGTYDLSGATITFGLEASDIPNRVYDPTPESDASFAGDLISVVTTAGLNAVAGDLVCVVAAGGTDGPIVALADATDGTKVGATFLITESINAGNAGNALVSGVARLDSWDWSGVNKSLFIGTTAGDMTETAPSAAGQYVQKMGYSLTPDIILFRPSVDIGVK